MIGSAYVVNTVIAAKSGKLSIKNLKTFLVLRKVQIYGHLNYDENFSKTFMGYCAITGPVGSITFAMFYVIGRVKELMYSRCAKTSESQTGVKAADQWEELSFVSENNK